MKRTNLVLDEKVLEEAVRVLGKKTYSETVNHALRELVRLHRAEGIFEFVGSGAWAGDLAEMRDDAARPPRRRRR
jgi:Arc/MetJ family transcription regulator